MVMIVPGGVVGFTLTTNGKLTDAFTAMVWPIFRVQVNVPVPPTAITGRHVQPAGVGKETRVVFAGIASVKVAFVAAIGPLFRTAWVYVILLPSETGLGVAVEVTAKSTWPAEATVMMPVAELFVGLGSGVEEETLAVPATCVPEGVAAFTFKIIGNEALAPPGMVAPVVLQKSRPVPPAAGVVQVHPAGLTRETKVVFSGIVS